MRFLSLNFLYRWPIEALIFIVKFQQACKTVEILWLGIFYLGNVRDIFPKECSSSPYDNLSLLLSHVADKLCCCEIGLTVAYFSLLNLILLSLLMPIGSSYLKTDQWVEMPAVCNSVILLLWLYFVVSMQQMRFYLGLKQRWLWGACRGRFKMWSFKVLN